MQQKTDFFSMILPLLMKGTNLTLTMKSAGEGKITVGVRPQRDDTNELSNIRSIVLTHTAGDLDSDFFETITEPIAFMELAADQIKEFKASVTSAKDKATTAKPAPAASSSSSSSKTKPAVKKKPVTAPAKKKSAPAKKVAVKKGPSVTSEETKAKIVEAQTLLDAGTLALNETKDLGAAEVAQKKAYDLLKTSRDADAMKVVKKIKALGDQISKGKKSAAVEAGVNKKLDAIVISIDKADDFVTAGKLPQALAGYDRALKDIKGLKSDRLALISKRITDGRTGVNVKLDEEKATPLFNKAKVYASSLNYGEMGKHFKEAVAKAPNHPMAKEIRESIIEKLGEATAKQLLD